MRHRAGEGMFFRGGHFVFAANAYCVGERLEWASEENVS